MLEVRAVGLYRRPLHCGRGLQPLPSRQVILPKRDHRPNECGDPRQHHSLDVLPVVELAFELDRVHGEL